MISYVILRKFITVTMVKLVGLVKEVEIVRMMENVTGERHNHACARMIYGDRNATFRISL